MNNSNTAKIEQLIGSEVDHFVYRVPKKNHDAIEQINKQFADIMGKYGTTHLVFQLNNTETPMDSNTNIAKAISANPDDEVGMELIFYRDSKHRKELEEKMAHDEGRSSLWQQSVDLIAPGTDFIMGKFERTPI